MCNHAALDRLVFRCVAVGASVLALVISTPAFTSEEMEINEVVEVENASDSDPMTAIEIIIGKRIPETVRGATALPTFIDLARQYFIIITQKTHLSNLKSGNTYWWITLNSITIRAVRSEPQSV